SVPLSTMGHAVLESVRDAPTADEDAAEKPQDNLFSLKELMNLEERRIAYEEKPREAEPKVRRPELGGWGPPPPGSRNTAPMTSPAPYGGPPLSDPPVTSPGEPPVVVAPKWPNEITLSNLPVAEEHQHTIPKTAAPSSRLAWVAAVLLLLLLAGTALFYLNTR
ncbi:MAG: hypothetical protein ABI193_05725, partial [Minicystis sp.]